ncbi:hypothetical protein [Deinococcus aluminii]|uniref:Uncharacterized protein n=1 Tax=Deinococcus aluminii TaxID=1656885 RepID=A0ABP9X9W1_9DEIO
MQYVGPLPGGVAPAGEGTPTPPPVSTLPTPTTLPVPGSARGAGGAASPNADGSCPASAPVKVSRSHIYHLPSGDSSYARTHAVSCFVSAAAAQAAGDRAPGR